MCSVTRKRRNYTISLALRPLTRQATPGQTQEAVSTEERAVRALAAREASVAAASTRETAAAIRSSIMKAATWAICSEISLAICSMATRAATAAFIAMVPVLAALAVRRAIGSRLLIGARIYTRTLRSALMRRPLGAIR